MTPRIPAAEALPGLTDLLHRRPELRDITGIAAPLDDYAREA